MNSGNALEGERSQIWLARLVPRSKQTLCDCIDLANLVCARVCRRIAVLRTLLLGKQRLLITNHAPVDSPLITIPNLNSPPHQDVVPRGGLQRKRILCRARVKEETRPEGLRHLQKEEEYVSLHAGHSDRAHHFCQFDVSDTSRPTSTLITTRHPRRWKSDARKQVLELHCIQFRLHLHRGRQGSFPSRGRLLPADHASAETWPPQRVCRLIVYAHNPVTHVASRSAM